MATIETRAVALRTYNLAEADKIVVWFTEAAGVVRGVARGARRLKSRFGAGLEPWTVVRLAYFEKEGRELVSLKTVEIEHSYFSLAGDVETLVTLDYLSELVLEFMPPNEANPYIYRLLTACGGAFGSVEDSQHALKRYFEVWLLRLAGFFPETRKCSVCGVGTDGADVFVGFNTAGRCRQCSLRSDYRISADINRQIAFIQNNAPEKYAQCRHDERELYAVGEVTARFIQQALERPVGYARQKKSNFGKQPTGSG